MSGLSPEEAADRTAIEQVWFEYWTIRSTFTVIADDESQTLFPQVMVDPALSAAFKTRKAYIDEEVEPYGRVVHRVDWTIPVKGTDEAVFGDCQDQSDYGLLDLRNKKVMTRGTKRVFVSGTFQRTSDGWKVVGFVLSEDKC